MSRVKDSAKILIGRTSEIFLPHLGREMDENRNPEHFATIKRAIQYARAVRAAEDMDAESAEKTLEAFWKGSAGDRFHENYVDERIAYFHANHAHLIRRLDEMLKDRGIVSSRMVEIGCGDGAAIEFCAEALSSVPQFVGIDINAAVIDRTRDQIKARETLEFHCADALSWLKENPMAGTVLFTNGGVLEYFTEAKTDALLSALAEKRPAATAFIEPLAPAHDLACEDASMIFGKEKSFSHNYPARLRKAGFEVVYEEEIFNDAWRWLLTIGIAQ